MLVLSRRKHEKIILRIPGRQDVAITVVRIDNHNRVRIGIDAEKEILVLRSELQEAETTPLEAAVAIP